MDRRASRATNVATAAAFVFAAATSCDSPSGGDGDRVERVVVTPSSASIQVGATLSLSAVVLDAAGNEKRGRKVVWLLGTKPSPPSRSPEL